MVSNSFDFPPLPEDIKWSNLTWAYFSKWVETQPPSSSFFGAPSGSTFKVPGPYDPNDDTEDKNFKFLRQTWRRGLGVSARFQVAVVFLFVVFDQIL